MEVPVLAGTAASVTSPAVNSRAPASMLTSVKPGIPSGAARTTSGMPAHAMATPAAPPTPARISASASTYAPRARYCELSFCERCATRLAMKPTIMKAPSGNSQLVPMMTDMITSAAPAGGPSA